MMNASYHNPIWMCNDTCRLFSCLPFVITSHLIFNHTVITYCNINLFLLYLLYFYNKPLLMETDLVVNIFYSNIQYSL